MRLILSCTMGGGSTGFRSKCKVNAFADQHHLPLGLTFFFTHSNPCGVRLLSNDKLAIFSVERDG
jgi:hypothetical protein